MSTSNCGVVTIAIDSLEERARWDAFVDASDGGTFYHGGAWLLALKNEMGQGIRVHAVVRGGEIDAGVVVREGLRFGVRVARKPWATAYNGVVTASGAALGSVEVLREFLLRRYRHVRLVQSPWERRAGDAFAGWSRGESTTGLLDVSDLDVAWRCFDRLARQRVRKAESLGVRVRETFCAEPFWDLYRMTYERQGLSLKDLPREGVLNALGAVSASGALRTFVADTTSGEPAAALVVGYDAKRAYFVLAGSHPELRKTDAMTLLWWNAFRLCGESRVEIDLVGMDEPTIARFKQSFSPKRVEFDYMDAYSPAAARFAFEAARRCKGVLKGIMKKTEARG
jgi:hypothetical protein